MSLLSFGKRIGVILFAVSILMQAYPVQAKDTLTELYAERADLRAAFEPTTYKALPQTAAGFLIDLSDWAEQYGWREDPRLAEFSPTSSKVPVRNAGVADPDVPSTAFIVLDRSSGQLLTAKNADIVWPIASLTKLVTTEVFLESGIPLTKTSNILTADDVGGAKLYVTSGSTMSVDDLLYATLVGSANNAANALARTTGKTKEDFVLQMNNFAKKLNLQKTKFVDPTGIELENVSTPREYARVATTIFNQKEIRRYTSTASRIVTVLSDNTKKTLTNTNWMLWKPEYDDVYVLSGKTGYLIESGWNLAVSLRPSASERDRELLIIVFGGSSRGDSFIDAKKLANWTWKNYTWTENAFAK